MHRRSSHRFLANRWLVHNWFMDLDNPSETIVYHFLIRGMTSIDHRVRFPMVSALVYMVTHLTRPTVTYDLRLSSSHNLIKLLYYVISQPWKNIEFVIKLPMVLTYEWDCKLIIYLLWIGLLLMEVSNNRYSQLRYHDISWDWDRIFPWVILRKCVYGNYGNSSF